MKTIKNLKGAKTLSKNEQKSINGGLLTINPIVVVTDCNNHPSGTRCQTSPNCFGVCGGGAGGPICHVY